MDLSVGLDFGTSNSTAAVYDGNQVQLVPLDPAAADATVMRTLLYLARDGERFVGQAAMDRYLEQNIGRPVKLERRYVGTIEMTFGGVGTMTKETYALVDVNEPGRLFQSIKTFLADRSFQTTNVFGTQYRLEDLIAVLVQDMLARVEAFTGQPVRRLTAGRPVHFSADEDADRLARERQQAAFDLLGLPEVRYLEEPVAAAYEYALGTDDAAPTALVFDFGGGTLDVSVVRPAADGPCILATGGVPIGGDLLDRRIVETHLLRHFGETATVGPRRLPMPRHIFDRLLQWQTMALLNRPQILELIRNAIRDGDQPRQLEALQSLISRNYGLDLYRTVELAKRELSDRSFTVVEFKRPGIDVREPLARIDFETAIRGQYQAVEACVAETVERAGIGSAEIGTVVTTGGSSRIPLFRQMLRSHFPDAGVSERGTFSSVATGLALAGARA